MEKPRRTLLDVNAEANRYYSFISPLSRLRNGVTSDDVAEIVDELKTIGDSPASQTAQLRAIELRRELFTCYAPPSLSGRISDPPFYGPKKASTVSRPPGGPPF